MIQVTAGHLRLPLCCGTHSIQVLKEEKSNIHKKKLRLSTRPNNTLKVQNFMISSGRVLDVELERLKTHEEHLKNKKSLFFEKPVKNPIAMDNSTKAKVRRDKSPDWITTRRNK